MSHTVCFGFFKLHFVFENLKGDIEVTLKKMIIVLLDNLEGKV